MAEITLAVSGPGHPVPGIDLAEAGDLHCLLHSVAREWIKSRRAGLRRGFRIVIADSNWVNPGDGIVSRTVEAEYGDMLRLEGIREIAARGTE